MSHAPTVTVGEVSFAWPDGTIVFDHLCASFGAARTGLIGRNGSGKSTLLRLIAGELSPTSGAITTAGLIGYLPQGRQRDHATMADALGITDVLSARAAIEDGSTDLTHYDLLEGRWDRPERALALLAEAGLPHALADLHRPATTLSGGEWTLTCLLGVILTDPDILLLDEPTNDLDMTARRRLSDILDRWTGPVVLVSHDRDLLERVDAIAELRRGTITTYGGGFSAYLDAKNTEQEAADRAVRAAADQLKREKQQKADAQIALARRQRYAKTDHQNKRRPKVVMNERKRQAQVSAGKYRLLHEAKVEQARADLSEAQLAAQQDAHVRIELPETAVPTGKTVLVLREGARTLTVTGADRIALVGPNGSGKTTLLELIARSVRSARAPRIGIEGPHVAFAYLDQHLTSLQPDTTVLHHVQHAAAGRTENEIRAQLARLLIRGRQADQHVGDLSGGERLRVALATALLARPAPQLLLLDEPTNNLDLPSTTELIDALNAYRGALIVASHDERFLRGIRTARTWEAASPDQLPHDSLEPGRIFLTGTESGRGPVTGED